MKNYHTLIVSGCLLLLSGCGVVKPSYFGDTYPPTTSVELFYSTHDVKHEYKVIGHLTIPNIGQDSVKARLITYGKSIGADAVVILGNTINNGKYTSDVVNADALVYDK